MGRKREEIRLKLVWNAVLDNGGNPVKVTERTGLPKRSVYRYLDVLCSERALRKIGKSPAVYEPTRLGAEQYQAIPAKPCHDSGTTSQNCGTTPMRQSPVTSSRAPQLKTFQAEAPPQPPASTQGTRETAQAASGLPPIQTPEVKPSGPVRLDYPARHHDSMVLLKVLQPADCKPVPDLVHWGPFIEGANGPWYRQAGIDFDFGHVLIQDFGSSIRLFLPERTVETRDDLAGILQETTSRAIRVSNWLSRQYGLKLGLPELYDSWAAYRVPETQLKGKWSGHFKVQLDDGSWVVFDQSKGYAEIEILVRAAEFSKTLRMLLAWANAPALLNILTDQVLEMKATMPLNIQAHVAASMVKALGPLAVDVFSSPEVLEAARKTMRQAAEEALMYRPSLAGRDGYA